MSDVIALTAAAGQDVFHILPDSRSTVNTAACIVVRRPDPERLLETVRSIAPQVDTVVVVVDAGSDMLAAARALRGIALVVAVPRGTGAGAAANHGVRLLVEHGAEVVVRLDPDHVAPADMVAELVRRFEDPRVAVAAGVLGPVGAAGPVTAGRHGGPHGVDACATSGSALRADVWREIGGWDEELATDHLEFDLCLRVRQSGYVVLQDPGVVVGRPARRAAASAPIHDLVALADRAHDSVWFARKHRGVPLSVRVAGRSRPGTAAAIAVQVVRAALGSRDDARGRTHAPARTHAHDHVPVHGRAATVAALLRGALAGAAVRRSPERSAASAPLTVFRHDRSRSAA